MKTSGGKPGSEATAKEWAPVRTLPQRGVEKAGRASAVHNLRSTDSAWQLRAQPVHPAACPSNSSLCALFRWPGEEAAEFFLVLVGSARVLSVL